jgi:hypothetical protein
MLCKYLNIKLKKKLKKKTFVHNLIYFLTSKNQQTQKSRQKAGF